MLVEPRVLPRDATDACVAAVVGAIQCLVVYLLLPGVVGGAVMYVTRSWRSAVPAALITIVATAFLWVAFSVSSLEITPDGFRFTRLLGTPKRLAWEDVVSVLPVTRKELVIKGWLWPLFPAREMTPTLTSLGHYRITWRSGFCYYPPADPAAFEDALKTARS